MTAVRVMSSALVPDLDNGMPKSSKPSRFSFARSGRQKGTEHLEQAVRKSADQRTGGNGGINSQRYIILPSSSSSSKQRPTAATSPLDAECILTRDPVPEPDSHMLQPQPLAPPRPSSRHPRMSGQDTCLVSLSSANSGNHASHPVHCSSHNNNNNTLSSSSATSSSSAHWSGQQPESVMHKPPRGWLHPDHTISESGVTYNVKYVGCLQINTSMRSLDFETRSRIAKECIARVCRAAGLRDPDAADRRPDARIVKMLAEQPDMSQTGADVALNITSATLNLTVIDTGEVIAKHSMPNISFASGGDSEMSDFVAYVAKDSAHGRACYVLECMGGRAQEVISTIGQAFELRFKEFLKRSPRPECSRIADVERDYYNDLPGKVPPDVQRPASPLHSDLIDLVLSNDDDREYVNSDAQPAVAESAAKDPFDMQPFNSTLQELSEKRLLLGSESARKELEAEEWFHGLISRQESETLVKEDGDFLVRESAGCAGQFVLTGRHDAVCKHLLLVDPDGIVRTKDRSFDSVSHLVHYHEENRLPIISAESSLRLKRAVRAANYSDS